MPPSPLLLPPLLLLLSPSALVNVDERIEVVAQSSVLLAQRLQSLKQLRQLAAACHGAGAESELSQRCRVAE